MRSSVDRTIPYLILCAICALVAIALSALWWRSYSEMDDLDVGLGAHPRSPRGEIDTSMRKCGAGCGSMLGQIYFAFYTTNSPAPLRYSHLPVFELHGMDYFEGYAHHRWRFGYIYERKQTPEGKINRYVSVTASHAFFVGVFALFSALFLRQPLRLLIRRRRGWCLHCGYDIRASADRCPECGTPVPVRRKFSNGARGN